MQLKSNKGLLQTTQGGNIAGGIHKLSVSVIVKKLVEVETTSVTASFVNPVNRSKCRFVCSIKI